MSDIWLTTNSQPWVEALLSGRTSVKTRNWKPAVKEGDIVLLHASKSKLWPLWSLLPWINKVDMAELKKSMGCICGIATVKKIQSPSWDLMNKKEREVFTLNDGWFCGAEYGVKYTNLKRLPNLVPAKGYQAPFVHAKDDVISAIKKWNPGFLKEYIVIPVAWGDLCGVTNATLGKRRTGRAILNDLPLYRDV